MTDDLGAGIKISASIAGAIGAAVAIIVERPQLGVIGYATSILTGVASANYIPPIVIKIWPGLSDLSNTFAFIGGLLAMHAIAGILKLAGSFQDDPIGTINRLKRWKRDGNGNGGEKR